MTGIPPLPRTFHTSSAAIGDCLYVFGGGDKGAEPVKDQQLHVFDTGTSGCVTGCASSGNNRPLYWRSASQILSTLAASLNGGMKVPADECSPLNCNGEFGPKWQCKDL